MSQILAALKDWQTLAAGALAIAAALVGGYFITEQIRQTDRLEKARLTRAQKAARATMPLTLSGLTDYAIRCGVVLRDIWGCRDDEMIRKARTDLPSFPEVPEGVVADLKEIIALDDGPVGDPVTKLLADVQVQSARLRTLYADLSPSAPASRLVVATNVEDLILDATAIYARSSTLFNYARRKTDEAPGPISWGDQRVALSLMGFDEVEHQRIFALGEQRAHLR